MLDSAAVEAWFAPEIPNSAGPGLYGGLPGLILMVTNAATGEVYSAESVELGDYDDHAAPVVGRSISREEYDRRVAWQIEDAQRAWEGAKRKLDYSTRQSH